jgi:hypothetical protein
MLGTGIRQQKQQKTANNARVGRRQPGLGNKMAENSTTRDWAGL